MPKRTPKGPPVDDRRLHWYGVVQPVPGKNAWMGWLEAEYSNGHPSMLRSYPKYSRRRDRLERKLRKMASAENAAVQLQHAAESRKERI